MKVPFDLDQHDKKMPYSPISDKVFDQMQEHILTRIQAKEKTAPTQRPYWLYALPLSLAAAIVLLCFLLPQTKESASPSSNEALYFTEEIDPDLEDEDYLLMSIYEPLSEVLQDEL